MNRLLVILLFPFLAFAGNVVTVFEEAGGGTVVSDDFDGYSDGDLGSVSANWTDGAVAIEVESGGVKGTSSNANNISWYSAQTFTGDVYCQLDVISDFGAARYAGPVARLSDENNYYFAALNNSGTNVHLGYRLSGTETIVTSESIAVDTAGIRLQVTGSGSATRLTVQADTGSGYANVTGLVDVDPSVYLSGTYCGIYSEDNDDTHDNWEAGDL